MLGLPICTLKSNVPESTLLVIQNFALPSVELLLNTKGDLQNSLCRLDFLTCTLKTYGLESTLLKIQNLASPFGEHLLKVLGHSIKKTSNVQRQILCAGKHTSSDEKFSFALQGAYFESFRSFYQRRPLD